MAYPDTVTLTRDGICVILGLTQGRVSVLHWGAEVDAASVLLLEDGQSWGDIDQPQHPGVWREQARGFMGAPALAGHRGQRDWSPLFDLRSAEVSDHEAVLEAVDDVAGLQAHTSVRLLPGGVVHIELAVTNLGSDDYVVDALTTWLPVPDRAAEVLDFTGRWVKERQPQRQDIRVGSWLREGREGRTGHDNTIAQIALTPGTSFRHGEAWSVALGWSGNSRYIIERTPVGRTSMGAGELLLPGEVVLGAGETYHAPPVYAAYSATGIDGISARYYSWLRSRPQHPSSPRPLTLNVWEAVWFDHEIGRLSDIVDAAAEIGVERFVLDDGWFHLRRDDFAGLGDWWVDPAVWPAGLGPLVDRVHARGMQFGLWFEPEMVNEDSDLFRNHPDWVVQVGDRMPPQHRHQQVLNIAHPDAWEYLYERMHALITEYNIAYIKWDHNRVLIDPGYAGRPVVHEQTVAFYRLVDALKAAHPGLEIESCASGGGRIDIGAAQHCDRFWTSDCNEALERQQIQRWTAVAIPPEMLGTHIGPPRSHSTGREHPLAFRATTALFGHAGIEWDITTASAEERVLLRAWADYYKAWRALLHSGTVVRVDTADPAAQVHGVVAADQSRALFCYVQLTASGGSKPPNFVLPGLDPATTYTVRMAQPAGPAPVLQTVAPAWTEGAQLSGATLEQVGLRPPRIVPESAFLIEVEKVR